MAVSNCNTFVDVSSFGSTVFLFMIIGNGMYPPFASMISFNLSKRIHKLLVLKKRCFPMLLNSSASSSRHMADSRNTKCWSLLRTAKCPPFLSFSVRSQHSIKNEASFSAKYVKILRSNDAPKLSELDTNMYLNPSFKRLSKQPDPTKAAYKSPCPGGHHSLDGSVGQSAGYIHIYNIYVWIRKNMTPSKIRN